MYSRHRPRHVSIIYVAFSDSYWFYWTPGLFPCVLSSEEGSKRPRNCPRRRSNCNFFSDPFFSLSLSPPPPEEFHNIEKNPFVSDICPLHFLFSWSQTAGPQCGRKFCGGPLNRKEYPLQAYIECKYIVVHLTQYGNTLSGALGEFCKVIYECGRRAFLHISSRKRKKRRQQTKFHVENGKRKSKFAKKTANTQKIYAEKYDCVTFSSSLSRKW